MVGSSPDVVPSAPPAVLPAPRQDLALLKGGRDRGGRPTWLIHDPTRNRYFQIGWEATSILATWRPGQSPEEVAREVARTTPLRPASDDVLAVARFLDANQLITRTGATSRASSPPFKAAGARIHWMPWLLHNYLFVRIPFIRPDRFLDRTVAYVRPLAHPVTLALIGFLGLLGLFLAGRQWDAFTHSFLDFLDWQGVAFYALALVVVKAGHELGHAYVAKAKGCKVPTMGVAFLVLMPVLYTDVTDSWRLVRRRDRLAVGAGGLAVELSVASLATLAWVLLPAGAARDAAYFLATTSWIMSLSINASPFMRFDGYYLLSDALGEPNLQDRGFALARWWIRERLWALGNPPPERMPARRMRVLVAWALAAMLYRFFLFLGIAVLVYHMTFKVLGLFLFAVEIWWFVLRPIVREIMFWWSKRETLVTRSRSWLTLSLALMALLALALPWRTSETIPALLKPSTVTRIHASEPARVSRILVQDGETVAAGDILVVLEAPSLKHDVAEAKANLAYFDIFLRQRLGDAEIRARTGALVQDKARAEARLRGLQDREGRLSIRAPFDGVVHDLAEGLDTGLWVAPDRPLMVLVDAASMDVLAYPTERQAARLRHDGEGRFIPDDGGATRSLRLETVSTTATRSITVPLMSSLNGGRIPVLPPVATANGSGTPKTDTARHLVVARVTSGSAVLDRETSGVAVLETHPYSPLSDLMAHIAMVVLQESSF